MRARIFLCTTLLMLCHQQLWSQAVTKQFPPASTAVPANAAQQQTSGLEHASSSQTAAEDLPDAPVPESALPVAHVVPQPPQGVPVRIEAETQTFAKTPKGNIYTLSGHIVIHYKDYVVSADRATFNQTTSDVVAEGHLRLDGGPDNAHLLASHGTMNLNAHTAHLFNVTGTLGQGQTAEIKTVTNYLPGQGAITQNRMVLRSPNPFAVSARELFQLGPRSYRVVDGSITSCQLPHPDWVLVAHDFFLDNEIARGKNSLFELQGLPVVHKVPVFYLPYVTHAVNSNSRQSGFEIPIIGNDTTKGLILGEDVYFVLGRSADLMVGAQYFSKRGFAPTAMFRYRGRGLDFANFGFNSLLDRLPGTENQGGADILFDGRRDFTPEARIVSDIEYLSSYVYRQEFEDNYAVAINSEVKSQAFIAHSHRGLAESMTFNRYQSFESSSGSTTGEQEIRILHIPTIQFDGVDQYLVGSPLMWGFNASGDALSRTEPGFQTSRYVPRFDLHPHIALPVHLDGWTLRPVVGVRDTFYAKSQNPGPLGEVPSERDATLNRKDFEAGVDLRPPAIERDFSPPWLVHLLGSEVRHTIEPDVQYRYVAGIDNFDSVLRFDSIDVASDTSELDYSLTQRLFLRHLRLHPCKGDEALGPDTMCGGNTVNWLTWQVAQKYFFEPDFGGAVTPGTRNVLDTTLDLTGVAFLGRPRNYSPVISRLHWQTTSATDLEWDVDYDTKHGRLDASNLFTSYKHGDFTFTLGDAHLHTLPGAKPASVTSSLQTGTASTQPEVDFNQLRLAVVYGSPVKRGLSVGANTGYDFTMDRTQYLGVQTSYNWNCCGLSFEVRRYALGTVPEHTTYLYNFTLANVGTAGSLSWATRVF
ncbi:MAG TPA: LPS assembly protein LptD [Acidobacteriaceae bacterium]|nr:LPS assembly protein LptD [Acidobacteriaceae bacterium]